MVTMNLIESHVAGATVVSATPFSELAVPTVTDQLPSEVIKSWVVPLYFGLEKPSVKPFLTEQRHLVTDGLISMLLANFNWRPRTAAAYLVALTNRDTFTNQIGRLLLRSDVCYAGMAYCLALAEVNSDEAVSFIDEYLSYYLTRIDLWFDQADAMAALAYLDRINGTSHQLRHIAAWSRFVEDKPNWNLDKSIGRFEESMTTLHALKHGV